MVSIHTSLLQTFSHCHLSVGFVLGSEHLSIGHMYTCLDLLSPGSVALGLAHPCLGLSFMNHHQYLSRTRLHLALVFHFTAPILALCSN